MKRTWCDGEAEHNAFPWAVSVCVRTYVFSLDTYRCMPVLVSVLMRLYTRSIPKSGLIRSDTTITLQFVERFHYGLRDENNSIHNRHDANFILHTFWFCQILFSPAQTKHFYMFYIEFLFVSLFPHGENKKEYISITFLSCVDSDNYSPDRNLIFDIIEYGFHRALWNKKNAHYCKIIIIV